MVRLHFKLDFDLRVSCVQDGSVMKLENPGKDPTVAVLRCPTCGFGVQLRQEQGPVPIPRLDQRLPTFRPQPRA